MLNVTDHHCISPATSKGGFPVIRVICHESVIYVIGHLSQKRSTRPPSSHYKTVRNIFHGDRI